MKRKDYTETLASITDEVKKKKHAKLYKTLEVYGLQNHFQKFLNSGILQVAHFSWVTQEFLKEIGVDSQIIHDINQG